MTTQDIRPEPFEQVGGSLALDFVNTLRGRSSEAPRESLNTYDDLVAWSEIVGGLPDASGRALRDMAWADPVSAEAVVRRARRLRESLFGIFTTIVAADVEARPDFEVVNGELERIAPHLCCLRWGEKGPELGWATALTLDRPLWRAIRASVDLLVSDDLGHVKRCEEPTCSWLFLDATRNHSRRWCDMKVCGNRAKARRFRARRKTHDVA